MTPVQQLETLIKQRILIPPPSSSGWCSVRCLVCNDHKHKKRGGWKFENDSVGYHCFNCGAKFVFDSSSEFISKQAAEILDHYGIDSTDLGPIKLSLLTKHKNQKTQQIQDTIIYPKVLSMPDYFKPLKTTNSIWGEVGRAYLEDRGLDPNQYDYHITVPSNNLLHKQWIGRLIIPVYRNDQLIFWQGRDMTGKSKLKYLSSDTSRESIILGYNLLTTDTDKPLYVVEGAFDAITIGGIAVFSNRLTKTQIELLKRSPRRKIIIPDKIGSGSVMAKQALDNQWEISIPDYGSCKDPTEASCKYGLMYVKNAIKNGIMSGTKAKICLSCFVE